MKKKFYSALIIILTLSLSNFKSTAQTGIPVPSMSNCDDLVENFLNTYDIPGATMAIARNGKLVYLRAFGHADIASQEPTQPYHRFRIASVSKPITSIAIMYMMEQGLISMDDKVFGAGGILENHPVLSQANITDDAIYDITVQQLLEHSAGWNRDLNCVPTPTPPYPYGFNSCDPIAFPLHVTLTNGTSNPVTEEDLILFLLEKGLDFTPGTAYSYSNIGYLVLGEIIEEISGMSYEDYVQETILAPLGICDMQIAKTLLEDKAEREGEYIGNGYTNLSCYGTGEYVPWEYGGFHVEAMTAHGGWMASARDLVRLLVAVDNFPTKPDILQASTINSMVTPSANNANYAKGWQVNSFNNWWHTGALDGTATLIVRTNNGFTWAVLLNKRVIGTNANAFWTDFDNLPWNCISSSTGYPSWDLMDMPLQNSHSLAFENISSNSVDISWEPGDGDYRMLVAHKNGPITYFPLDGTEYSANTVFGSGDDLGDGCFVVYAGNGNACNVSGLNPASNYSFRLIEFNKSATTGDNPLYMLCNNETDIITTLSTGISSNQVADKLVVYPVPASDKLTIELPFPVEGFEFVVQNNSGNHMLKDSVKGNKATINIHDLPSGFYHITLYLGQTQARKKFVVIH